MSNGWLTPFSPIPAGYYCARIRVPNGTDWRGPLNGLFQLLVEQWNWEQYGTLDPQATVEILKPLVYEAQNSGDWCMIGAVWPYASETPPPHTLVCDGATLNRVDYPSLYAAIDPVFIIDADTFSLPNLVNRFVFGADLTDVGSYSVGQVGGEINHTLTVDELAAHTHTDAGHVHSEGTAAPTIINGGLEAPAPAATPSAGFTGSASADIQNTGGDQPHNNMPPYLALRWCIVFE